MVFSRADIFGGLELPRQSRSTIPDRSIAPLRHQCEVSALSHLNEFIAHRLISRVDSFRNIINNMILWL
jgi:hypothetical protein